MTQAGWEVSYVPGTWAAVVWERTCLLVELPVDEPRVSECWQAMRAGARAEGVLDVLCRNGLAGTPGFALAAIVEDGVRLLVRGPARAHADGEQVMGTALTWNDQVLSRLPSTLQLSASAATDGGPTVPAGSGVLPAASLRLVPQSVTVPDAEVPAVTIARAPQPPDTGPAPPPASAEHPAAASEPLVALEQAVPLATGAEAPDYTSLFAGTVERDALIARIAEEGRDPADAEPADAEAVDAEAVDGPEQAPDTDSSHVTAAWRDFAAPLEPATAVADAAPTSSVDTIGLIATFPWENPAPGLPVPQRPAVPEVDAHPVAAPSEDEALTRTRSRADLLAMLRESEASRGIAGPSVLAVYCGAGHATSPYAPACRTCGAPVTEQAPVEIPRPTLGILRLPTGDTVELDKGVVLGRAPHAEAASAAEQPNLVKLADPGVSRNHAQVTLDGWQVLLRDLGSANGTEIQLPGRRSEQLRPNEDYPLEPGTRILVAGELQLAFEVEA